MKAQSHGIIHRSSGNVWLEYSKQGGTQGVEKPAKWQEPGHRSLETGALIVWHNSAPYRCWSQLLRFKSLLNYLLSSVILRGLLNCLCLSFFTHRMGTIIVSTTKGCFKNSYKNINESIASPMTTVWMGRFAGTQATEDQEGARLECWKTFLGALRRLGLGEGKTGGKKAGRTHTQVWSVPHHCMRSTGLFSLWFSKATYSFCFLVYKKGVTFADLIELEWGLRKLTHVKLLELSVWCTVRPWHVGSVTTTPPPPPPPPLFVYCFQPWAPL